jgi:hypothetical protein
MSVRIVAEVWEQAQVKGSALLLLLALADHADSVHARCYPSIPRLAHLIRMSPRNTQYLLRKLEAAGHLAIQHTPRQPNQYQLLRPWCKLCTPGAPPCTQWCNHVSAEGARALAPDPKTDPKEEEKRVRWLQTLGLTPGSDAWHAALNGSA